MASPFHLAIPGSVVVVGKQPDGDSVRLVADDPSLFAKLRNGHRVRPSRDGSVQLRLEAIDAPEIHYNGAAQPLGPPPRDHLLAWLGFGDLSYAADGMTVEAATPLSVRAAILSKGVDVNGRPISYLIGEDAAAGLQAGRWTDVTSELLGSTFNHRLLDEGDVYPTFYSSTPQPHREALGELARGARSASRGVWAHDATPEFDLSSQQSIGPDGELILPKLFRRSTDYLRDVTAGRFTGTLPEWIRAVSTGTRDENDGVVVCDGIEVKLADLIQQSGQTARFQADPTGIVFIEK